MKIGLPREIKEQENRVAMTPAVVHQLINAGHTVFVQKSAGIGAGFSDNDYKEAGATITDKAADVFGQAELVVKVKEPLPSEYAYLRPDLVLFTYLHLAASKSLTEALLQSGVTAVAYETVKVDRRLPLLEPMSEIAGRMAPIMGGYFLAKHQEGNGTLLTGVPGVAAGKVLVLGGGVAGFNAARVAAGMGADVTFLDVDGVRIRYFDTVLENARDLHSNEDTVAYYAREADLIISAVLRPGAKAPKLIKKSTLSQMKPGSVIVDIAIDQGGSTETSKATTHQNPIYIEEGIIHYCVANMPGAYPRTSTQALTNATCQYIDLIANLGLKKACEKQPALIGGINTFKGELTCKEVADAHNLPYTSISW